MGSAGERERRRGRLSRLGARARSSPWAVLVLANVLPIGFTIFTLWGYRTGKISFLPGSEAVIPSLVVLAVLIVGMVFLSWVAAPLLRGALTAVHGFIHDQTTAIARGGPLGFLVRFPALVGGMVLYGVLVVNVLLLAFLLVGGAVMMLVSLAAFAAEVMRVRG